MSDEKLRQYQDSEGKPIGLLRLVKIEPEWACNQIRHRDKLESERDALQARVKRLEEVGDQMATWLNCERNLGNDTYTAHLWKQSKESKP